MKKVLITGPTGAVGMAVIKQCIEQEIEVYAICRPDSERKQRIPNHALVHIIECDLDSLQALTNKDVPTSDIFFHLGWVSTIGEGRNDMDVQLKNIQYTLEAVRLAKRIGCDTFIGAGSQAEYGRPEAGTKLNADVATFPESGYGMAKLCAGQMSRIECEKLGLKHIWVRILSVYGPYDGEKTMIMSSIRRLLAGKRIPLTEGGQEWDYLYSEDAARALLLIGEKGIDHKIYCLGNGKTKRLRDYVEIMRDCVDSDSELGFGDIPYSDKQIMYLCADITELTRDVSFTPNTEFREGIRLTIEWARRN